MAVREGTLTWVPRHWVYKEEINCKDDQPVADGEAWEARAMPSKASPTGRGPTFLCVGFLLLLLFGAFLICFLLPLLLEESLQELFLRVLWREQKINGAKLPQPRAKNIYAVLVSRPEQIPRPSAWGLCRLKIPILSTVFFKKKNWLPLMGFHPLIPTPLLTTSCFRFSFTLRCLIWTQQVPTHPQPRLLCFRVSRFQAMIPSVVRAEGSP